MAFKKKATFKIDKITPLNNPTGWEMFNLPDRIKTASRDIEGEDLGGFDLKQATKEHPDHLYIKIFAIKKDEPNDNGDAFNEYELKQAFHTFIGVPIFTNHQNDDVEKARGKCIHSWYSDEKGGIFIIATIDKVAYPKLARGIEEGYIVGSSMGTSVEKSVCSVCHNLAHVADEYCSCVKERKNRKFSGSIKCRYYDSKVQTDEKCPLCGSTKDDIKVLNHKDQMIYEHNYGLKFIENSFVVNPACHDCGVHCILHVPNVQKKVASLRKSVDNLIKYSTDPEFVEKNIDNLEKIGGVQELNELKESMDKLEGVVKSMMKQKENVSYEYVSDIVKAISDVQGITDELTEMGYGALPSPEVLASEEGAEPAAFPEPIPAPDPMSQTGGGMTGNPEVSDMGGLGSITKPKISSKNKIKNKDFIEKNGRLWIKDLYFSSFDSLKSFFNSKSDLQVEISLIS
ncbi:hypothetical protein LCGC14_0967700 [marine sediment metagenome]|uniref:Uncharacterized protein n=1 Tax=marine sediment metagenome TaxID=412755 RepID=A0A0F9NH57_9ZZZZ